MNFDTRTIIDIINLNSEVKKELIEIILEEKRFSEKIGKFDNDIFIDTILPLIKNYLKTFLKKELNNMGLSVLKGYVNLNNIDYPNLIKSFVKI